VILKILITTFRDSSGIIIKYKMWNQSKQEYVARINRVMDYIGANLANPIDLSILAGVASFSPYHFHRIFTCLIGETPIEFLSRLRMEKAGQLLLDNPGLSIGEVSERCGFSSTSVFSRSFKAHFGCNAGVFRAGEKAIYIKDGIRYSKNCKPVSKIGKNLQLHNVHICNVELNQLLIMNSKIEVKQMPEMKLIYCRHMGPFNQIGNAYEKLFKWAGPRGLVTESSKTVTVYHDDPSITSVDKVRQDASIIVEKDVFTEGEIGKFVLPGGKYAVGRFELRETDFEKAWNTMCSWLSESGYQPGDGCTYELYHNHYNPLPEHIYIVDICIPVKPL
jgi:AraC family transcriptional regulator